MIQNNNQKVSLNPNAKDGLKLYFEITVLFHIFINDQINAVNNIQKYHIFIVCIIILN